ncbi:hypothetical protein HN51_000884 [Arachis hypogaea]|uniref:non-specific serine/threonine protein kinase n=1 Tax=Arachis hypogaea TaxID=3818 RepID=A0A445EUJ1_ARAHY|nr:SRSF protein kinase 3-like [Arachis hypogaea]QHO48882.1 Serine/threonine-protein kinase SRPK [Arachis hypogaea]RYR78997.1 hypothetical protein Ahy_A01g003856 [Arachis hypogaea]
MMSCSPSSSSSEEEDESFESYRRGGYHAVKIGDQFAGGRYIAQKKLGWGQFSTVWLAYDTKDEKYVALKIQKSAAQFVQAALHEIDILSAIGDGSPSHTKFVAQLIDHFKHTGPNGNHLCMVLEFLGDSLLRLIKYTRYKGIPLKKVREICTCILIGLDYLHREHGIIHTDLKPENILLISPINPSRDPLSTGASPILERPEGSISPSPSHMEKRLKRRARRMSMSLSMGRGDSIDEYPKRNIEEIDVRCKIVDFGNACWADNQFTDLVQTRQYRAPEVILQAGYSYSIDMWSFACIAFELATGDMLFNPRAGQGFSEDEDHLALMMELLGKFPKKMATSGAKCKDFFDRFGDLKRIRRLKMCPLKKLLVERYKFSEKDANEFSEFLLPLLDLSPEKRPSAQQCLQHPWIKDIDYAPFDIINNGNSLENLNVGMRNLQIAVGK